MNPLVCLRRCVALLLAVLLVACGGGGSGDDDPLADPPAAAGSEPTDALVPVTGPLDDAAGQVGNLVTTIGAALPEPIGNLLVGVAQTLPTGIRQGIIRLMGNNLQLMAGTAAFDATFTHNGLSRRFVVIRPQPVRSGLAPVLLLLHGNGGTAENQANIAEVAQLVADAGVWAVMPQAVDGVWDDDPARPKGRDDVGFVRAIIDVLTAGFAVDAQRVSAAGLSNGAFMASRLACEASERIAGFGFVAGSITGGLAASCAPLKARRIMLVNGTTDPIVPYDGGRIGLRSVPQAFAFWLGMHGCVAASTRASELPDLAADGTTIQLQANNSCGSGQEVRLYTVRNGGHAWPGGWQYLPIATIGTTSQDIEATREIWQFVRDARR